MNQKLIPHIGIMQGRLLPKYQGRYQAHPVGYWQDEFPVAASLGLNYIEWILDFNDAETNPLLRENGTDELQKIIAETGVGVRSICADYFMEAPLHSRDLSVAEKSREVLLNLMQNAAFMGITDIVIPCVDQSSLKETDDMKRLVESLQKAREHKAYDSVNLALETDLNPERFSTLLNQLPQQNITVNYDSGNSASLGFNVREEFAAYGTRISDIHIKDRVLGGGSVELGTGNTDFETFFECVSDLNFKGIFVMQAFRDDEGVAIFQKQFHWLNNYLNTIA